MQGLSSMAGYLPICDAASGSEAVRHSLLSIRKGYIKGIIGLPANLFYGTGISACIVVVDKGLDALVHLGLVRRRHRRTDIGSQVDGKADRAAKKSE